MIIVVVICKYYEFPLKNAEVPLKVPHLNTLCSEDRLYDIHADILMKTDTNWVQKRAALSRRQNGIN